MLHPLKCVLPNRCAFIDDVAKSYDLMNSCFKTLSGQEEALAEFQRLARQKLSGMDTPLVVSIIGDSGTGKTEVAVKYSLALSASGKAAEMVGGGNCLIVLDCAHYDNAFNDTQADSWVEELEGRIASR